ncbi:MAG: DNA topoisomerase (ATP-hydrolyzing) subunit B [bacterium]|nr:DNA topoisomerase (ATP-hydrolyzing) subunit B [bacterium]
MQKSNKGYSADEIKVLQDIEAVRHRPSMYIGDTEKYGLHHLVFEITDNSIDEAIVGFCNRIEVTIGKDESITVKDNGRGIPVDEHPEEKKSALEVVMTILHAGGKFDHKAYKVSGGLHGVGLSVVNALSEWLEVKVVRENKMYHQRYQKGKPVTKLTIIEEGDTLANGTEIHFMPDKEIFSLVKFSYDILAERLRELAFLNKGVTLTLTDARTDKFQEFFYKGGIVEFITFVTQDKETLHPPIYFQLEKEGIDTEVCFQYTTSYTENMFSYANNINTKEGGTHLIGFKAGLTRVITNYIKEHNLSKNLEVTGDDTREGITAVISVKVRDPQFEGQTKTKLGNSDIKGTVESITNGYLSIYFEENPKIAESIINKILSTTKTRLAAQQARDLSRKKNIFDQSPLPGKLADCSDSNPELTEIYIVEGDSAGGSAKQGRDRKFQAILPIKGKILNVEKASEDKIWESEEIKAIMKALGLSDEKKELRYYKVIIMTDADVDGLHIRTLLLTLFYRHAKDLIEKGHIYIAQPPLYRVKIKSKSHYIYTDEELNALIGGKDPKPDVQRYKGLGEMNPEELFSTTMDPNTRTLKQVTLEDSVEAERMFTVLMGDKVEPRRNFIEQNAKYVQNLDV